MPGFVPTGALLTPRSSFAATRLDDGRVLVAGGTAPGGAGVLDAEVYDPAAGTWSAAGALTGVHVAPQLVATDRGAAVVGGDPGGVDVLLETWDAATNGWSAHVVEPSLAAADGVRRASDHLDVLCGTRGQPDPFGAARLVEVGLADGQVRPRPTPGYSRSHAFVTTLADGTLLACAGVGLAVGAGGAPVEYVARTSESQDPVTGAWTPTGRLAVPHLTVDRSGPYLVALGTDALLVAGGDQVDGRTDVVEHFSAATGRWMLRAPLPDARDGHAVVALGEETVLVIGGETADGVRADGYTYDVATDAWNATDAMTRPRTGHAAVALTDGSVLVVGGADGSCERLN
ncbi:Kelch repeat-containing protein [Actinomycetospora straminea]|uniref:Galactose oxidase-like protein n=1 Tax=Actinomycetospora straminea TaxID=663607 RepID=A0ABP9F5Q9_9PSEU|nr:kelch repeat-containing protein [Actinomycetospora straminea]MDD7936180.1 kelch repeat-containing protein [Actinomycetospora straminea]